MQVQGTLYTSLGYVIYRFRVRFIQVQGTLYKGSGYVIYRFRVRFIKVEYAMYRFRVRYIQVQGTLYTGSGYVSYRARLYLMQVQGSTCYKDSYYAIYRVRVRFIQAQVTGLYRVRIRRVLGCTLEPRCECQVTAAELTTLRDARCSQQAQTTEPINWTPGTSPDAPYLPKVLNAQQS